MSTKDNVRLGNGTLFFNEFNSEVSAISEYNFTSEDDILENDFKAINSPSEVTFECSAKLKIPFRWKLRWKWDIFQAKICTYRKYRKTFKQIRKLYRLERKLRNESS